MERQAVTLLRVPDAHTHQTSRTTPDAVIIFGAVRYLRGKTRQEHSGRILVELKRAGCDYLGLLNSLKIGNVCHNALL